MSPRLETVRDKLGDPAGWPSVPYGFAPPNESYLLSRLVSVSCTACDVVIVIKVDGVLFTNMLVMDSESEAKEIVARLRQRVGDLLLEVIDAKI